MSFSAKPRITVAHGDGIGPEIMNATLRILEQAGAQLEIETIDIGEKVYLSGHTSGIKPEAWDSLKRTRVFLKAPITTPQGGGYKSLNVTVRKSLGLYANIRPCLSYHPFVATKHPVMDLVIVRENEEDLYAGIEHRQTDDVYQCLKIITRPGCEKIVRYAFEYAVQNNRKKVTCFAKDNIMKLTDGLFRKVFDQVAKEYPQIKTDYWIVDIGAAKLADTPEAFDVIVMQNLYGDILSDVAAQIAGSVGMAGSSNIGDNFAMFEAIHGTAPDIAGKNLANPSGLLQAACMMLVHLGQNKVSEHIQNAWAKTIEEGIHTGDIFDEKTSSKKVGTREFADAIIERLGKIPKTLKAVKYPDSSKPLRVFVTPNEPAVKKLVGQDVFIHYRGCTPEDLAKKMEAALSRQGVFKLDMVSNRGLKVWPHGSEHAFCTDHWRCRIYPIASAPAPFQQYLEALSAISGAGLDVIKTENLYEFNGEKGFSLGQGQ